MTTIIEKISKSRSTILEILNEYGWDISNIPILSANEIDQVYNIENNKNSIYSSFGVASGCNFKLAHKLMPSHYLHIIYYNMPTGNQSSVKVNKSIVDKILNLYNESIINSDDSLSIIINDPINETVEKLNDSLNVLLQENYNGPSEQIKEEMSDLNLVNNFFRNVTINNINTFQINILNHSLVPTHKPIRNITEINNILEKHNVTINQIPIISKNDIISKVIRLNPGELCQIIRYSKTAGEENNFRICK